MVENPDATEKVRPVILVERGESGGWWYMGLTTNPSYAAAGGRDPLPDFRRFGFDRQGYLWADHLNWFEDDKIRYHQSWITTDVVGLMAEAGALWDHQVGPLLVVALRRWPSPAA